MTRPDSGNGNEKAQASDFRRGANGILVEASVAPIQLESRDDEDLLGIHAQGYSQRTISFRNIVNFFKSKANAHPGVARPFFASQDQSFMELTFFNGKTFLNFQEFETYFRSLLRNEEGRQIINQAHDFIQMLPTGTQGKAHYIKPISVSDNPGDPNSLNPLEFDQLKSDPTFKKNYLTFINLMLEYYGLKFTEKTIDYANQVARDAQPGWKKPLDHNHARLSRMMESCLEFGFDDEAKAIYSFLQREIDENQTIKIDDVTRSFWDKNSVLGKKMTERGMPTIITAQENKLKKLINYLTKNFDIDTLVMSEKPESTPLTAFLLEEGEVATSADSSQLLTCNEDKDLFELINFLNVYLKNLLEKNKQTGDQNYLKKAQDIVCYFFECEEIVANNFEELLPKVQDEYNKFSSKENLLDEQILMRNSDIQGKLEMLACINSLHSRSESSRKKPRTENVASPEGHEVSSQTHKHQST